MADNFNAPIIEEFRNNEGKVSGMFAGMELLLLTSKFTTPLAYTKEGDNYVVIASKAGAPTNPDWYHNLKAHPEVTIEVGPEKFEARTREVKGTERDRLYEQHAKAYAVFNDYEAKTSRKIPVFVIERV
jgi:deazaflavin-dependent oxidoreductase (nitroreductase family)